MDNNETRTCCICGGKIEGYGYNAYPVKEAGRCCRNDSKDTMNTKT